MSLIEIAPTNTPGPDGNISDDRKLSPVAVALACFLLLIGVLLGLQALFGEQVVTQQTGSGMILARSLDDGAECAAGDGTIRYSRMVGAWNAVWEGSEYNPGSAWRPCETGERLKMAGDVETLFYTPSTVKAVNDDAFYFVTPTSSGTATPECVIRRGTIRFDKNSNGDWTGTWEGPAIAEARSGREPCPAGTKFVMDSTMSGLADFIAEREAFSDGATSTQYSENRPVQVND